MRSLPHIVIACGLTWGAAKLGALPAPERQPESVKGRRNGRQPDEDASADTGLDFRLVALGSLLPDLVDKTFGRRFYRDDLGWNDHTFGHTLAFNLALAGLAMRARRRRRDSKLLSLATGSATHLLVDPVIREPRSLFWPLLGARFPRVNGLGRAATLASQAAAFAVIVAVLARLAATGRLGRLVRSGTL